MNLSSTTVAITEFKHQITSAQLEALFNAAYNLMLTERSTKKIGGKTAGFEGCVYSTGKTQRFVNVSGVLFRAVIERAKGPNNIIRFIIKNPKDLAPYLDVDLENTIDGEPLPSMLRIRSGKDN